MSKLGRFVQIMSAIGWTLIVCLLLFTIWNIFSPHGYARRGVQGRVVSQMTPEQLPKTKMITFSAPVVSPYSDYVMIPVGQQLIDPRNYGSDSWSLFSKGDYYQSHYQYAYYSYSFGSGTYNNILFYKKDGSESYLLFDTKVAITNFYYPFANKTDTTDANKMNFLLLGIVEDDYNKDGFLTSQDAVCFYMCNLDGRDMKVVTPKGTQFIRWDKDDDRDVIFVTYREDSNHDRKFDLRDQMYLVEVDIKTKKMRIVIIDSALIEKIKSLAF